MRALRWSILALVALPSSCSDAFLPKTGPRVDAVEAGPALEPGAVSFARDIRPLMNRSDTDPTGHGCKTCHYKGNPPAIGVALSGLNMESLGTLRLGGSTSGSQVVVPGKPEESAIVKKLRGTYFYGTRMPKDGPAFWTEEQINLMEKWIREGARGADTE